MPLSGSFQWCEGTDLGDRRAAAGHFHAVPVPASANSPLLIHQNTESTKHSLRVGHCARQLGPMQVYDLSLSGPLNSMEGTRQVNSKQSKE